MRLLFTVTYGLFGLSMLSAQDNDSILYNLTFYFEDAIGNKDTVYIGGSPYVSGDEVNPSFGEINLIDVPFDSVFEVRVTRAQNLEFAEPVSYVGKKRILQYALTDFGPFPCDWNGGVGTFAFVANVTNPPLTISWDPQKFRQEENIGCLMSTNIVNSFIVGIIDNWFNVDQPPGREYVCIGSESSKTFYPLDTPTGIDLDWRTYAVLPVEGSSNQNDTLAAYFLNFVFSGGPPPPCNVIVDTEEPVEYSPQRVYPNPTTDFLQFEKSRPEATFTAFTTDGRAAFSQLLDAAGQVNVSGLASGLYFYRISEVGQRDRSGRFVRR
jgi:hypothetical protein